MQPRFSSRIGHRLRVSTHLAPSSSMGSLWSPLWSFRSRPSSSVASARKPQAHIVVTGGSGTRGGQGEAMPKLHTDVLRGVPLRVGSACSPA